MAILALVTWLALLHTVAGQGTEVDIHVMLDGGTMVLAESLNSAVTTKCPHNDIDLSAVAKPHVTLYLTQFRNDSLDVLKATVNRTLSQFANTRCSASLSNPYVLGAYGMWNGTATHCLQLLSDTRTRSCA